jgi:Cellulose biosynthesis GIL
VKGKRIDQARRLAMPPDQAPMQTRTVPVLGVHGLSEVFALLAGGLAYAVALDDASIRLVMIAYSLRMSLERGVPCVLILTSRPRTFLRKAKLCGVDLSPWVATRALRIFSKLPDAPSGQQLCSVQALIADITESGIDAGTLVVLEHAESEYCLPDPDTVSRACTLYSEWLDRIGHVLLSFFDLATTAPKHRIALRRLTEHVGGFAKVLVEAQELRIEFVHWCGAHGVACSTAFPLALNDTGAPSIAAIAPSAISQHGRTGPRVIATVEAIDAGDGSVLELPHLRVVSSMRDALILSRADPASLVLLHFSSNQWEELLAAVITIRSRPHPKVTLVIREHKDALRAHQTALLVKLGVAFVVPRGFTSEGARILIGAVAGSVTRQVCATETPRLPRLPEPRTAPLRLIPFKAAVESLLDTAELLDLPQSLIIFSELPDDGAMLLIMDVERGLRDVRICCTESAIVLYFFASTIANAVIACERALHRALSAPPRVMTDRVAEIRLHVSNLSGTDFRTVGAPLRLVKDHPSDASADSSFANASLH